LGNGKEKVKPADRRADSLTVDRAGLPAWLHEVDDGVLIDVHLQPGARRSAICGEHGGRLKIATVAPPLEGRANDALVEWLAHRLGLPQRRLHLVSGRRSRDKTVRATGIDATEAVHRLAQE
jgi:hypothetical protein